MPERGSEQRRSVEEIRAEMDQLAKRRDEIRAKLTPEDSYELNVIMNKLDSLMNDGSRSVDEIKAEMAPLTQRRDEIRAKLTPEDSYELNAIDNSLDSLTMS